MSTEQVILRFLDVGRTKRTWEARLPLDGDAIVRHVAKSGALMSRCIEIDYDDETGTGVITAGFRVVGRIVKVADAPRARRLGALLEGGG